MRKKWKRKKMLKRGKFIAEVKREDSNIEGFEKKECHKKRKLARKRKVENGSVQHNIAGASCEDCLQRKRVIPLGWEPYVFKIIGTKGRIRTRNDWRFKLDTRSISKEWQISWRPWFQQRRSWKERTSNNQKTHLLVGYKRCILSSFNSLALVLVCFE